MHVVLGFSVTVATQSNGLAAEIIVTYLKRGEA